MITVGELADYLGDKPFKLIKILMAMDVFVSADHVLSTDELSVLGRKIGLEFDSVEGLEEQIKGGRSRSRRKRKSAPGEKLQLIKSRPRIELYRPVTITQISEATNHSPQLLKDKLGELHLPISPSEVLDDKTVKTLGKMINVKIRISDDRRGGVIENGKLGPIVPKTLKDAQDWS